MSADAKPQKNRPRLSAWAALLQSRAARSTFLFERALARARRGSWGAMESWTARLREGESMPFGSWDAAGEAFSFFEEQAPNSLAGVLARTPVSVLADAAGLPGGPAWLPPEEIEQAARDDGQSDGVGYLGACRLGLWARGRVALFAGAREWAPDLLVRVSPPDWTLEMARREGDVSPERADWLWHPIARPLVGAKQDTHGLAPVDRRRVQLFVAKALADGFVLVGAWRALGHFHARSEAAASQFLGGWAREEPAARAIWSDAFRRAPAEKRAELVEATALSGQNACRDTQELRWQREAMKEAMSAAWGSEVAFLKAWPKDLWVAAEWADALRAAREAVALEAAADAAGDAPSPDEKRPVNGESKRPAPRRI
jgi:hypothetical protein